MAEHLREDRVTPDTIIDSEHAFYGVIQPRGKTGDYKAYLAPDYPPEAREFYLKSVENIDRKLQEKARSGSDPLVRVVYPAEQVRVTQEHVDREIEQSLIQDGRQLTIGSFYGVQRPFMRVRKRLMQKKPEAAGRLSGAIVSSTVALKREPPILLTTLDPRWGDPTYAADIWEDMADSVATAATIAVERFKAMLGRKFTVTYPDLPTQMLRGFDGDFRDYTNLYQTVVELMEAANIALALPVSKNEPFIRVLEGHVAAHTGSPWAMRQGRYLSGGRILTTGQHQWLMGADQFDSGLDGKIINEYIPVGVRNNPKAAHILAPLPHSRLRIGSYIQDIVELTGTAEDLCAFVGKTLRDDLKANVG